MKILIKTKQRNQMRTFAALTLATTALAMKVNPNFELAQIAVRAKLEANVTSYQEDASADNCCIINNGHNFEGDSVKLCIDGEE